MTLKEEKVYKRGGKANFYQEDLKAAKQFKEKKGSLRKIIKPQDMFWEDSPQGRIKHLLHEKMEARVSSVDIYMQELPPGGHSGKHRHTAEEFLYILEGSGYDLHWDAEVDIQDQYTWKIKDEPKKFSWEKGDMVYIPPMSAHQHFNTASNQKARFLAVKSRMYKYAGYPDLEQLEEAPLGQDK